jgi:hypothetical protein
MKTSPLIFTLKNEKAGKMPFSSLHFKMNFKTQTRIRFEEKQMELLKNWQLVLKEILLYYHNVNRFRGGWKIEFYKNKSCVFTRSKE